MIYRLSWVVVRCLLLTFLRMRVRGAENVPASGGILLASNHISNLDPPVVGCGLRRTCAFMGKEELFRNRAFGWLLRKYNTFPVKRGSPDRSAIRSSLESIERGLALVMFPEGTRSEDGELKEPEGGVGLIVYKAGVPVVPVLVQGTDRVLPRGGGIRLHPVCVTYGAPLHFDVPEGTKPGREEYEAAARRIMAAIAALKHE